MTRATDLTPLLKRLQLGPMAATLPERIALARREQLDYASFLEIILSDEVNRRAHRRIEMRLQGAGFQETCRLEDFDWSASITMDRRLLDATFSLEFLARHEHVLLVGPARGRQELPGPGPGLLRRQSGAHRALQPRRRLLQDHGPSQGGQLRGAHLPHLPDPRPAHPRRPGPAPAHRTEVGGPLRAHPPTGTGRPASSSPATVRSRSGWAFSTTPSWATAHSTGWPTPATRSSSRAAATGNGSPHTGPCWRQRG